MTASGRAQGPLTVDPRMVATARATCQQVIDGNYFAHNSPALSSPFDQMRFAASIYRAARGNLADH